jgi:hypothetical protein
VDLSEIAQVAPLPEMVLHSHQGLAFKSSQSHHPIELPILMKSVDLLHEMALQMEIPE